MENIRKIKSDPVRRVRRRSISLVEVKDAVPEVANAPSPETPIPPGKGKDGEQNFDGTVEANLEEVFSLGYIPLDSFAKKIEETKKLSKKKKIPLTNIDFGHDGYITDALIRTFAKCMPDGSLDHVTRVSLEGCSIVTDIGLHWLVQALERSSLKRSVEVNINGCSKVTDGGLCILAGCKKINTIQAMATCVSHVRELANTRGCPLLYNPNKIALQTHKQSYLMIVPLGTQKSLSKFLVSRSNETRQPFQYTKGLQAKDWTINLTEAERSHILFEHLLPHNPVHIIVTFDGSQKTEDVKTQLVDTVAHVLSKERPNPKHIQSSRVMRGSDVDGFMDNSNYSKCSLSVGGVLRNTSNSQNVIGAAVSQQPLSRTNNYYEIQCMDAAAETGLILGIMHDVLYSERFPLDSKERNGGAVEGFEIADGVTYGFGVEGQWDSEYVPGKDSAYYFTKNGRKIEGKTTKEKPQSGMYPIVAVLGKNYASLKLLNAAQAPESQLVQWEKNKQVWSPGTLHNLLCDDQGVLT
ncbi:uncharacterized protein LOC101856014 [Aplysia californica]|uniref:Uncharacterized protein LOC101856014 n=1 Tax=Aplysia californica TaxID=6500 RepID=A0ABM0ZX63_APLCA|nr:uncharacterized protein LOC101856014 [Aplysia californica]